MVNRLIWSAVITLSLTFSPSLALSTPTKTVKKKSTKTQSKVTKKSKSSRKAKVYRTRSYSRSASEDVVESSMVPSYSRNSVAETPPLMKVIPQRDGKFLLEPLSAPKKTLQTPLSEPQKRSETSDRVSSATNSYNKFEPWDFSQLVLSMAKSYRHAPYARGASLETGSATDCSGFTQFIYHGFKINLPRSSAEQAQVGKVVTRQMDFSKLLPGDLLFFRRGGYSVGHAGIYLGEGKMIHASTYRTGVTVTDLRQPYYEGTFVVAKRVFEVKYPE
ncbi:MAG: C40 family peptidase [Syntrophobacterales bacterium]|jgi:cell wall-associated NlpC family hydrolase|nr:C40 family peptidase [Syntrophobacterales bacterium]